MSVSLQAPLDSKPRMWDLENDSTEFDCGSELVPASVPYQYAAPTSTPGSSGIFSAFNRPQSNAQPLAATRSMRVSPAVKHTINNMSKSAKIKRSMSTPNIRCQVSSGAVTHSLSAEKRKNKLGYQRTSVACGHCRRRKIRCIPAPADKRCTNCIRLKKECNFFSVDQQQAATPSENRDSRAQGGIEWGSEEALSSSTAPGSLPELSSKLSYPHARMPLVQDLGGLQIKCQRTESFSLERRVVQSGHKFDFDHAPAPANNWLVPDESPISENTREIPSQRHPPHSSNHWTVKSHQLPLTPDFSPFTPDLQVCPPNWPLTEVNPRDDLAWSTPATSISFDNLESLHENYQYAPTPSTPPTPAAVFTQATNASEHGATKTGTLSSISMYPPPISTTSTQEGAPESSSALVNRSRHPELPIILTPPPISSWQQPPYSYAKPASTRTEPYVEWNGIQSGLSVLRGGRGGNLSQPLSYAYDDLSHGMFCTPHQDQ